jgi:predicted small lipoprotein YifL
VKSVLAAVLAAAMVAMLAGCGSDTPKPPPQSAEASAAIVKKDCADPNWKAQNLGLWYSICRKSLSW